MSWHVRYVNKELHHEMLSPEFESKSAALEHAWSLAQEGMEIAALEGPDEELLTVEEIELWFDAKKSNELQK